MKADVMRQVARLVSTGGGGKFGQTQTLTQLDHRSAVSDEPTFHVSIPDSSVSNSSFSTAI
jgi:hypothetical protein